MKKFSLALALFALTFVACTTDGQDTASDSELITKNTSGNATIDGLYNVMVNSPKYIAYKKAQTAFIAKMKYTGNVTTISTSSKVLTWIGQNLGRTNFTSVSAAQAELNNVRNLYSVAYSANMAFFNALSAQPNPGYMWGELTTSSWPIYNPCLCLGPYISSMAANATAGNAALDAACEQISINAPGALESGFDAINSWDAANAAALDAYNACVAACN